MTQRLANKRALVFGGGSPGGELNNGLATALAYAAEGASVGIVDRDPAAVEGALAVLRAERPEAVGWGHVADVSDEEQVAGAVSAFVAEHGGLEILHNNVGIARMGGPLEMEAEEWDLVMRINLTSMFLTTKYALPHLLNGGGSIVNIASVGGLRYIGYDYPSYAASKSAVVEFTKAIAIQHAREGVRANVIAPGYIRTPMMFKQISGNYASVEDMIAARNALSPTGVMGRPEDVAAAAVFLASDEAAYVNAVCLPVDGGLIHRAADPVT
ncbi:SDR family NAD(P)-dependent oxidoreductase [Galactobacter valiniphilus]|uniref:SDR family NAD(P)-dependent oxidoreductase n=1 Tax=Galactobacter valiniphilus TaxID=2676122 RepID=UPI003735C5F1